MAYSGAFHLNGDRPGSEASAPSPQPEVRHTERRQRPSFDLSSLFKKTEAVGWETDDLLLALVLYLMYCESGDKDLLIMLAVMLLT